MKQTVVIVGAGQAGLQTAIALRQGGYPGRVILLGDEAHLPYQRPPLSKQVLKGEFDASRCTLRSADSLADQGIDFRPGQRATALHDNERRVTLADGGVLDFDHLVIATGARLNRLALEGSSLAGVHYLRTLDDAVALRERLRAGQRLVVAGGGYIGLEVAASACALGCTVTVVEAEPRIMRRSALPAVSEFLLARHRDAGVAFHLGRRMIEIHGSQAVRAVRLDDGASLEADTVLIGLGVRPEIRWLEGSGVETARGVLVDAGCRTSREHVYAAGDCAETAHPWYPAPVVLESVQNAVTQGKLCATAILGQNAAYEEVPWFWSEQHDCRLQMAGLPQPGDELVLRRGGPDSLTVLSLGTDRLHAVQCVNAPRDYMAARKLIAARDAVDCAQLRDVRAELGDVR